MRELQRAERLIRSDGKSNKERLFFSRDSMYMHNSMSEEDELHVLYHNSRLDLRESNAFAQTQDLAMVENHTHNTLLDNRYVDCRHRQARYIVQCC